MAHRVIHGEDGVARCGWGASDSLYRRYHDHEWGRPVVDDRVLFEKICLEGFQAGLSWITILRKREAFREVFHGFDIDRVAELTAADVERLLGDARIVRHRGKITAAIHNAGRARALRDEVGSLAAHVWSFEPTPAERPERLDPESLRALTTTPASTALSKDLKRRGWRFVGPTTAYAFMQAMGLVNDHLEGCHARAACEAERAALARPTRA